MTDTNEAPSAFNRHIYHEKNMVFYGTDDGSQDGSFGELPDVQSHYDGVEPVRRENIHLISVVGGLYGLNLIPLWRPREITFFDINPVAIAYFNVIRRVLVSSRDAAHFLARLTDGDYDAEGDLDVFIKENIAMKQRDSLPPSRGSSKRSYEQSWRHALENFDLTKGILTDVPVSIRNEPMEAQGFRDFVRDQRDAWFYCSNVAEFVYFDLELSDPANVVLFAIIHPEQPQLLDLAPWAGGPVRVNVHIPMTVERLG